MQAKTIFLKDYKPSPFNIDSIDLVVDIHESETIIQSTLKISRRPEHLGQKLNLELNGENMKLLGVKLNQEDLSSDYYQVSSDKLVILNILADDFILEIKNSIDPASNKALEGFYKSGGQYCTQCEPEGFRKITYFIDRPDVMAIFSTKMIADKKQYPYLLSNGNKVGHGDLPGERHWVEWQDPFKKPAYLFAMVAGDFEVAKDQFTTMTGRKIVLEIFVDRGNLHKTAHAMESLKTSMKWDEETFGLEYDLDIYMIVSVDSFNMGAMENKGLNIFNSTYTLADEKSATDSDFQNIQGVIGHEYFHNWTGNRVTCRDWFQLTLKEGLTVYRDQEFSADMLSRAVKRVEDVRLLKEVQFPEDAGPLSHPVRPSSYIEINNFYTRTVYEKGAEVIRMIETLIGKETFRKGMDKYFELFDGMAVTTEDFVHAMELASGKDLTQFKNWYSRAGTPILKIQGRVEGEKYIMDIEQQYPQSTQSVPESNILALPFRVSLLTKEGSISKTLEINQLKQSFRFKVDSKPIPSLNRGFSAPVNVEFPYEFSELIYLMSYDDDAYCRYEATQKVYNHIFMKDFESYKATGKCSSELMPEFKEAFGKLLGDTNIDLSFKSYLLALPSENTLAQEIFAPDFDAIHKVHIQLMKNLGLAFHDWFVKEHKRLSENKSFDLTPSSFGKRALKNQCLSYLVASGTEVGMSILESHYFTATNMTEEIHALGLFIKAGVPFEHKSITSFYEKWKKDSLVMLKWFGSIAAHSPQEVALERMIALENDPHFEKQVPNFLRSLYFQFAKNNLSAFHSADGKGYQFLGQRIKLMDTFNPQIASRGATMFSLITKVDDKRRELMKFALKDVMEGNPSKDTYEVISKYLGQ